MIKQLLFLVLATTFICIPAWGQDDYDPIYSSSKNSGALSLGFWEGGAILGAEFEHQQTRTHSLVGTLRIYTEDKDRNSGGLNLIGGMIRPHFKRRPWDFYISPGIAILMIETPGGDDETDIGAMMQAGILYEFNSGFALGAVHTSAWAWFSDDVRGQRVSELSVTGRFQF